MKEMHEMFEPNSVRARAVHLLESGYDMRTIPELLGRNDLKTTMTCMHALNKGCHAVHRPVDGLLVGLCSLYKRGTNREGKIYKGMM